MKDTQGTPEPIVATERAPQADQTEPDHNDTAWAVSIEVDGRQRYLFETDKLQEMVGASAIMRELAETARVLEGDVGYKESVHVFQPASGEVRAWSTDRELALGFTWKLRKWLTERGVEHTAVILQCRKDHFVCDLPPDHHGRLAPQDQQPDEATDLPSETCYPSLAWVHQSLSALARRVKNAKPGSDARPVCSLFEACRLHGLDFANEWNPKEDREGLEKRRALRGYRARAKFRARQADHVRLIDLNVRRPLYDRGKFLVSQDDCDTDLRNWVEGNLSQPLDRAITIDNLTLDPVERFDDDERTDQFVAFACADGDGMGRLLTGLNWNLTDWGEGGDPHGFGALRPWERNRAFSAALDDVVRKAFLTAAAEVTLPDLAALERLHAAAKTQNSRFVIPVLPQIQGGDDLWTITRKTVALRMSRLFASNVQKGMKECPIIERGRTISESNSGEAARSLRDMEGDDKGTGGGARRPACSDQATSLSVSQGIAFAKAGHPVHAMIEAAESLLDSAKALRKGQAWRRRQPAEGCIDWHWIESSLSETVGDARARGAAYVAPDTGDVMLLTTRPWTQTQAECFERAARLFRDKKEGVPRRKREQLDGILRRGRVLSLVAWEAWWKRLRDCEREAVRNTTKALKCSWETWCLPRSDDDGMWKQLDVNPWFYVGELAEGEGTRRYYVTPFLDLLALDDLAGSRVVTNTDEEVIAEAVGEERE